MRRISDQENLRGLKRADLTDGEFQHLLDEIMALDVFTIAKTFRAINGFTRDHDTPLIRTPINIKDWCKNSFEVVSQLRIKTDSLAAVVSSLPFFSAPCRGGIE